MFLALPCNADSRQAGGADGGEPSGGGHESRRKRASREDLTGGQEEVMSEVITSKPLAQMSAAELRALVEAAQAERDAAEARAIAAEEDAKAARAANAPAPPKQARVWACELLAKGEADTFGEPNTLTSDGFHVYVGLTQPDAKGKGAKRYRVNLDHAQILADALHAALAAPTEA